MSNIDRDFIDQVLASTDIVEVIKDKVDLKKNGSNYKGLCPFHNEKTPSFNVSSTKQFYHCFGCGASGDAIKFLTEYEHITFIEALSKLAQQANLEMPSSTKKNDKSYNLFISNKASADYFARNLNNNTKAMKYLEERAINMEMIKEFHLGYSLDSWDSLRNELQKNKLVNNAIDAGLLIKTDKKIYDRFRNRVMFPIKNSSGNIIGFGGRSFENNKEAKYINSPETKLFHKSYELYGLYESKKYISKNNQVIIVEGYTDIIGLHQSGVKNCVATLGTAFTKYHFSKIIKYTSNLVFCFDGDNAGKNAAWKAIQNLLPDLKDEIQIKIVFLPDGHDPDSAVKQSKDTFIDMINNALPLSEYIILYIKDGLDLDNVEGKTQFFLRAKDIIKMMPEITYTNILKRTLEEIAGNKLDSITVKKSINSNSMAQTEVDHDIREITLINLLIEFPDLVLEHNYEDFITNIFLKEIYELIRNKKNNNESFSGAQLMSIYPNNELINQILLLESNEKSSESARVTVNKILDQLEVLSNEDKYFELLSKHSEGYTLSSEEREFIRTFKK